VLLRGFTAQLDRAAKLADGPALLGAPVEQVGALARRERFAEAQRALVLRRGLAVGANRRRPPRRGSSELQHGRRVAGRFGVVGQARRVGRRLARQGGKRLAVQCHSQVRRQRVLDRDPR
jgi:hypothetical protein